MFWKEDRIKRQTNNLGLKSFQSSQSLRASNTPERMNGAMAASTVFINKERFFKVGEDMSVSTEMEKEYPADVLQPRERSFLLFFEVKKVSVS